jgi:hypothetical protein
LEEETDGIETDKGKTSSVADGMNASLLVSETTEACVPLHEANGSVSPPVYEADEQLNNRLVNENALIDTSISEADEQPGVSIHKTEAPGVSKNE